jgi:hypothetical protein
MLKVQELYQERLSHFQYLQKRISDLVWEVLPPSDSASVDDLIDLRKLDDKLEEALQILEGLYVVKKMIPNFNPPMRMG